MRCPKCGNEIEELFFKKGDTYVCRKCLIYNKHTRPKDNVTHNYAYTLDYTLTKEQLDASGFILENIKKRQSCVLEAVTGAGKTEIIYESISYGVSNLLKVGVVIPRKDVVIELVNRLQLAFKQSKVVGVYGSHTEILSGDIIVLTSHQLFRYPRYFDILIIDEVDAFPFYNNELLEKFLLNSVNGCIVYMSATIPKKIIKQGYPVFKLNKRYHGEPLDIPRVRSLFHYLRIKNFLKRNENGFNLIYFPTIKIQEKWDKKIKREHYIINSKTKDRKILLERLHEESKALVLTTLVLERGVTFKNTNVLVYLADHELFSFENLVQIAGRVGRKKEYPHGEILFLVNHKNQNVRKAIKFIKKRNE